MTDEEILAKFKVPVGATLLMDRRLYKRLEALRDKRREEGKRAAWAAVITEALEDWATKQEGGKL